MDTRAHEVNVMCPESDSIPRVAVVCSMLLCTLMGPLFSGCSAGARSRQERTRPAEAEPQVLVIASGRECPSGRHPLMKTAREEADALSSVMRSFGGPEPTILYDPRVREVEEHIRRSNPGHLLLLLIGHGTMNEFAGGVRSAFCLVDGALPIDEMLMWLPAHVSQAVVVLDSCLSAHVDVRRSAVPTSVISATPELVDTERTATLLTSLLIESLHAKPNSRLPCAVRTDDELLAFIEQRVKVQSHPLNPKLRRNTPQPIILPHAILTTKDSTTDCVPAGAPTIDPTWVLSDTALRIASDELRRTAPSMSLVEAERLAWASPTTRVYAVSHDSATEAVEIHRLPGGDFAGRSEHDPRLPLTEAELQAALASPTAVGGRLLFPEIAPPLAGRGHSLVAVPCETARGQCFLPPGHP